MVNMGIFQTIVQKYKETKQRSLNKEEFKNELLQAVNDGKLSGEEIEELNKKQTEFGLSEEDIKGIRIQAYTSAFSSAKSDENITREEEEELLKIQKYLGIEDVEIEANKKELHRMRILDEIQKGNIPQISVLNLVMGKDEKAYWSEPSMLVEEKVISSHYEGGSRGMSFRIMKGVSYRVGAYRGHIVSEQGLVPVSSGDLIITKKRVIFRGDNKSFATDLNKILDIQLFSNGIFLAINNRTKKIIIKFIEEGNHQIIGALMSYAVNHFGDKPEKSS